MQILLTIILALFIFNLSPTVVVEDTSKTLIETSAEEDIPDKKPSDDLFIEYKFSVYTSQLTKHIIFAIYIPKSFEYQNAILRPPINS